MGVEAARRISLSEAADCKTCRVRARDDSLSNAVGLVQLQLMSETKGRQKLTL